MFAQRSSVFHVVCSSSAAPLRRPVVIVLLPFGVVPWVLVMSVPLAPGSFYRGVIEITAVFALASTRGDLAERRNSHLVEWCRPFRLRTEAAPSTASTWLYPL